MEEIILTPLQWTAPEYTHKEKSVDFLWTIGIITLIACGVALWFASYLFSIFIFISGCCLILFSIREPQDISFSIETEGFSIGRDKHTWKDIKGFTIIRSEPYSKLLIQTSKYFLPIYTIPLPNEFVLQAKESLLKVIPNVDLHESHSMIFMEKLGF